jgi:hypothetical protein
MPGLAMPGLAGGLAWQGLAAGAGCPPGPIVSAAV